MTIHQRRKYREEVLARELERAYRQAAIYHLTISCRNAMAVAGQDPARARELHQSCIGEEWGHPGCLCYCHDVITEGVASGVHG